MHERGNPLSRVVDFIVNCNLIFEGAIAFGRGKELPSRLPGIPMPSSVENTCNVRQSGERQLREALSIPYQPRQVVPAPIAGKFTKVTNFSR